MGAQSAGQVADDEDRPFVADAADAAPKSMLKMEPVATAQAGGAAQALGRFKSRKNVKAARMAYDARDGEPQAADKTA
jgi:hypothetical protein